MISFFHLPHTYVLSEDKITGGAWTNIIFWSSSKAHSEGDKSEFVGKRMPHSFWNNPQSYINS